MGGKVGYGGQWCKDFCFRRLASIVFQGKIDRQYIDRGVAGRAGLTFKMDGGIGILFGGSSFNLLYVLFVVVAFEVVPILVD